MRNKRHGWGSLYDKEGSVIFEGYMAFGNIVSSLPLYTRKDVNICNFTRELTIGGDLGNDLLELRIEAYIVLERVTICDNYLNAKTKSFCISSRNVD